VMFGSKNSACVAEQVVCTMLDIARHRLATILRLGMQRYLMIDEKPRVGEDQGGALVKW
jgi:hypothetical protein